MWIRIKLVSLQPFFNKVKNSVNWRTASVINAEYLNLRALGAVSQKKSFNNAQYILFYWGLKTVNWSTILSAFIIFYKAGECMLGYLVPQCQLTDWTVVCGCHKLYAPVHTK